MSSAEPEKLSTGLTAAEQDRLSRILLVRSYAEHGVSKRRIAAELDMSRLTVDKYLNGEPELLCRQNKIRKRACNFGLGPYISDISACIKEKMLPSEIYREIKERYAYQGSMQTFRHHFRQAAQEHGWNYRTRKRPDTNGDKRPQRISRAGILNYLWNHGTLSPEHKAFIFENHPVLYVLDRCIREFRDIFSNQCVCRLHCFIENHSACGIKPIESFVTGLLNDIDAVECAVSYDWSNGFVEGTNNCVKMVKRTMFGRCMRKLLEAKMLLKSAYRC